jgi:hypothetical protein
VKDAGGWRHNMTWADKGHRLVLWADRLPFWLQFVVLPPVMPLWSVVAAACCFPRTMAFSAVVLSVIYVPLIASGVLVVSWREALAFLGWLYIGEIDG